MKHLARILGLLIALLIPHGAQGQSIDIATAEEILRKSGAWEQVADIGMAIQSLIEQSAGKMTGSPPDLTERLKEIAGQAYSADRLRPALAQVLASRLEKTDSDRILEWLNSDPGRHITAMEVESSKMQGSGSQISRGAELLAALPKARIDRFVELTNATRSTEAVASFAMNAIIGIQRGILSVMPNPAVSLTDIEAAVRSRRAEFLQDAFRSILPSYALSYQSLSDDELDLYIAFSKSESGNRYSLAMTGAFDKALAEAAENMGKGMAATLSNSPPQAQPQATDVILIPTEDFPFAIASQLADYAEQDTGLKVRAMLNMASANWLPMEGPPKQPGFPQYDPKKLTELAKPTIEQLKKIYGGSLHIFLTTRDINFADRSLNFLFAFSHNVDKVAVISVARLLALIPETRQIDTQLATNRLRKMILRAIANLHLGMPRSADPRNILYSPIMSADQLDALDGRLN